MMNDDTKLQLSQLQQLRDIGVQEQTHRRLTHRRYNPDLKDMTDLELNQAIAWYRHKIDTILKPFEAE